jgi:hypothetical protein
VNYANSGAIGGIDFSVKHEGLAGAVSGLLHTMAVDLGELVWLQEAETCIRRSNKIPISQTNADVAGCGVDISTLEQRATHAADFVPHL